MVSLQDSIRLGRSEAERLGEFLRNIPSGQWATPSACTEWQVADVVGHLTWVGEFYANPRQTILGFCAWLGGSCPMTMRRLSESDCI